MTKPIKIGMHKVTMHVGPRAGKYQKNYNDIDWSKKGKQGDQLELKLSDRKK